MRHSEATVATIKRLPPTYPLDLPEYPTMGWDSALTVQTILRSVGGVASVRRHPDPDYPQGSCYSVVWWYRGFRTVLGDRRAFDRWLAKVSGTPLPEYLRWEDARDAQRG